MINGSWFMAMLIKIMLKMPTLLKWSLFWTTFQSVFSVLWIKTIQRYINFSLQTIFSLSFRKKDGDFFLLVQTWADFFLYFKVERWLVQLIWFAQFFPVFCLHFMWLPFFCFSLFVSLNYGFVLFDFVLCFHIFAFVSSPFFAVILFAIRFLRKTHH